MDTYFCLRIPAGDDEVACLPDRPGDPQPRHLPPGAGRPQAGGQGRAGGGADRHPRHLAPLPHHHRLPRRHQRGRGGHLQDSGP